MQSAGRIIQELNLQPHPEGGWFREIYRAPLRVPGDALPERFDGPRNLSAAIYFLLERGDISRMHRLQAEELWVHLDGGALELHTIDEHGELCSHVLGTDEGAERQLLVPPCVWFGSAPKDDAPWVLVLCVTTPAFEYGDFELGDRGLLVARYPEHAEIIRRLTPADAM